MQLVASIDEQTVVVAVAEGAIDLIEEVVGEGLKASSTAFESSRASQIPTLAQDHLDNNCTLPCIVAASRLEVRSSFGTRVKMKKPSPVCCLQLAPLENAQPFGEWTRQMVDPAAKNHELARRASHVSAGAVAS